MRVLFNLFQTNYLIMELIDIAFFTVPNDASVLESILSAEKILYFINFENSAISFPGTGVILSICENDRDRVVKIIRDAGFGAYLIG